MVIRYGASLDQVRGMLDSYLRMDSLANNTYVLVVNRTLDLEEFPVTFIYVYTSRKQTHTHTRDLADQSQTSSFSNITTYKFYLSAVKYRGCYKHSHYYIIHLTLMMLSVGFFSFQNITLTVLTVILSCDALGKPREV